MFISAKRPYSTLCSLMIFSVHFDDLFFYQCLGISGEVLDVIKDFLKEILGFLYKVNFRH